MYSRATTQPVTVPTSYRTRPLSQRTQMMARGPGWALADGEAGSWQIKLLRCDDPVLTWTHLLGRLRDIAGHHGLRPVILDLRIAERLTKSAMAAAAELLAEFERIGMRVAVLVGPDYVHAIRLHRLVRGSAAEHGCCCMTEDEALEWVRDSAPPICAPLWLHPPRAQLQAPRV